MCIIIVKPANVQLPDYETLCRCARNNPDGFGFAVSGEKPYKTLDFEKFANEINKIDEDLPMIIHFRKATHGSIKKLIVTRLEIMTTAFHSFTMVC